MQKGSQSDVIVMDFSKAFDKVSHNLLTQKLSRYGIQGLTNKWIRNWLSHRKRTVVLDGQNSYEAAVRSGVPQGSVLGPCLFLYYINDIPDQVKSSVRLFADHTIMYLTVTSQNDANQLQSDLQRLAMWANFMENEIPP